MAPQDPALQPGAESSSSDFIVRALAQVGDGQLRVVALTASRTCADITHRHQSRGAQGVALARATCAGLLLATLTKRDEETVTLQIIDEGPVGPLTVDATAAGRVRAYPRRTGVDADTQTTSRARLAEHVGTKSVVNVVRDLGLRENFAGQTPLVSGEIDIDVEHYLTNSEQIDSVLVSDAVIDADGRVRRAAGLLIQAMPGSEHADLLKQLRERLHGGALFEALVASSDDDAMALVRAALPELADLDVLDERPVSFNCPCNRERAENTLALLGSEDLGVLLNDPGSAEVVCEFCQTRYHFSTENLAQLRNRLDVRSIRPS